MPAVHFMKYIMLHTWIRKHSHTATRHAFDFYRRWTKRQQRMAVACSWCSLNYKRAASSSAHLLPQCDRYSCQFNSMPGEQNQKAANLACNNHDRSLDYTHPTYWKRVEQRVEMYQNWRSRSNDEFQKFFRSFSTFLSVVLVFTTDNVRTLDWEIKIIKIFEPFNRFGQHVSWTGTMVGLIAHSCTSDCWISCQKQCSPESKR